MEPNRSFEALFRDRKVVRIYSAMILSEKSEVCFSTCMKMKSRDSLKTFRTEHERGTRFSDRSW
jgi:hypothetical protein